MSEMIIPKTLKNLIILLQVPISNVTNGVWRFLFILMLIACVLISPGTAEAYVG